MRSSTLSRTPAPFERKSVISTPPFSQLPTIRVTTATPSAMDTHSTSPPTTTLAPKAELGSRKRLVPKKSKLGLLGGSKKEKTKDLSDVARRVGAHSPTLGRSFEIYVDPADDPDIGEIVVLKKKKSRVGLNEVQWGPLGDVTNTGKEQSLDRNVEAKKSTTTESTDKAKDDEREKWWTKRGRKDSKGRPKAATRMKSKEKLTEALKKNRATTAKENTKQPDKSHITSPPEQSNNSERRQRSQSMDAGMLFGATTDPVGANFISVPMPEDNDKTPRRGHIRTNTSPSLFGERPPTLQDIAAVTQPSKEQPFRDEGRQRTGSIALRAIRSVRSLARIGSWAQLKNMPDGGDEQPAKKTKEKPERKEKRKKERTMSMRSSKSGFEALKNTLGSVRKTVDLSGTIRSVSSQATAVSTASDATVRHGGRQSGASIASTVRYDSRRGAVAEPIIGRASKSSGASTIRWNDQVDAVKERDAPGTDSVSQKKTAKRTGSKKISSEGRKRPGLASLFPDMMQRNSQKEAEDIRGQTTEPEGSEGASEASATLLDISSVTLDSPSRRVRPRPQSEQMLGRERPRGIIGDKDTGVIRILDNVTTDLACLINRLDLEVTPTSSPIGESPRGGLIAQSQDSSFESESVAKKVARQLSMDKLLGSLRSHTHRRKRSSTPADCVGQKIAPWPESDIELNTSEQKGHQPVLRREDRRLFSSSVPPAFHEPASILRPLPAPTRPPSNESVEITQNDKCIMETEAGLPASFATFGKKRSNGTEGSITPTKTMRRARRDRGSSASQNGLALVSANDVFGDSTRPPRAKHSTLGSMGARSVPFDPEDPDGDIPAELRMLLNRNPNQSTSYSTINSEDVPSKRSSARSFLPSPGTPPREPLPPVQSPGRVFLAPLPGELSDFNDDAFIVSYDDENDTKRSFDFTAELGKLDYTGEEDNKSFAVQLEEAFKTPKKYSIRGLGSQLGFGVMDSLGDPPVPAEHRPMAHEIALPGSPEASEEISEEFQDTSLSDGVSDHDEDMCMKQPFEVAARRVFFKPSQGRLNPNFKFGRETSDCSEPAESSEDSTACSSNVSRPSPDSREQSDSFASAGSENSTANTGFLAPFSNNALNRSGCSLNSVASGKAMALSDIIPPADHESRRYSYSTLGEDESAMLRSILEKAANLSEVSLSLSLGSGHASMNGEGQQALDRLVSHSRQNSDASFSGLSTYSERRRGFEFGPSRPAFYPPGPAGNNSLLVPNANWRDTILSLGSVSSYGRVIRDGAKDPFDYAVPSKRISEDMSYSVEDTFSFLRQDPMRQRVDSGASKYSFDSQRPHVRPDVHQRRSRRQAESIISVASGPPVSLYNRGFNPGRTTFAWRQRTTSFESVASGYSVQHLGRPGVGDKMFESARDLGVPLAAISASPSQVDSSMNWHSSYDSLVDDDRDRDSLMDDTGRRSMMSSQESLFGRDNRRPGLLAPPRFRPVSVYSFETQGSPKRDDDTVITMLDGGFVRRRSIRSMLEGSPCARKEKRPQKHFMGQVLTMIPSKDNHAYSVQRSPSKARLITGPSNTSERELDVQSGVNAEASPGRASLTNRQSYVSTCSSTSADQGEAVSLDENPDASRLSMHFGSDRMSLAQHGLLERRSLEDCCLSAEGEDATDTKQSLVVFRRPEPAARRRSVSASQVTATSSSATPPLTRSRSSSQFTGSQGSIDLDRLNVLLTSPTNLGRAGRDRLRRRGSGHRRKISEARASRTSSVYETIEEAPEFYDAASIMVNPSKVSLVSTVSQNLSIPDLNVSQWEQEDVGPALRMIHALQHEVRLAVDASQRQWADTAYSIDALQAFQPSMNPADWKSLLEHSLRNFGPLPPEFHGCTRRPRTTSRPSPYPRVRVFTRPPDVQQHPLPSNVPVPDIKITGQTPRPLQEMATKPNVGMGRKSIFSKPKPEASSSSEPKPKLNEFRNVNKDTSVQPDSGSGNGVLSAARRLVPRSGKRYVGKSPRKGKENAARQDMPFKTETLRISRPRPLNRRPSVIPRTIRV